jgi:hypothetical protein
LFAVVLAGLLVATALPVVASRRPSTEPRATVNHLEGVEGSDACGLLSDNEILRASGADSVSNRTPGPLGIGSAGCYWQLESTAWPYGPGELWVDVQPSGGRAMFDLMAQGDSVVRIGGLGDGAFEQLDAYYAVKGDTLVYVQFLAFGGGDRPSSLVARALTWLIMKRLRPDETAVRPTPTPGPTAPPMTAARALVERLRSEPFGDDNVDAATELLARSGIGTYASPADAEPIVPVQEPASPMVLLRGQVRAMALEAWAGSGLAGEDLDPLVPGEPGLVPASYILAGYVAAVDTEGAQAARALMGEQEWAQAPSLVYPQLVLTLFASDLARDRMTEVQAHGPRVARAAALALTRDVRTAQAGICTAASNFISGALAAVFNALRLGESGGGSIFRTIWNFVVTIAETVVTGIVRAFSEEVLHRIGQVAGLVGAVASVVSFVRPWTVDMSSVPSMTRKGIGADPAEQGRLQVRVLLEGPDEWPKDLADCARSADKPLPNLKPEGAPVTWEPLEQTPGGLVAKTGHTERLDAQGAATLDFVTLVDDVPEPWETRLGFLRAKVTVNRPGLKELADIGIKELLGLLDRRVEPIVRAFLSKPLDELEASLERLISQQGSDLAYVIYHVPAPTPEPSASPTPTPRPRSVWVHVDRPAFGTVVEAGRLVEFVSCSGPYGPWTGVLRFGGIKDLVPWSELPVAFSFRGMAGVQRTTTATGGRIPWTLPGIEYQADIHLDLTVDGQFITLGMSGKIGEEVVGNELLAMEGGGSRSLLIEPAPEGMCRP